LKAILLPSAMHHPIDNTAVVAYFGGVSTNVDPGRDAKSPPGLDGQAHNAGRGVGKQRRHFDGFGQIRWYRASVRVVYRWGMTRSMCGVFAIDDASDQVDVFGVEQHFGRPLA
jgi:hypothetical protein